MSKYNIGAGLFRKDGWTNIDNPCKWYKKTVDKKAISYDLLSLDPLPIETETADIIYCSHVIEHVTDEAVENMVKESYRALKPGGVLRITAPDIDLDVAAYKSNNVVHFDIFSKKIGLMTKRPLGGASIEQKFLWHFAANASELHAEGAKKRISDNEFKELMSNVSIGHVLDYCTNMVDMKKQKLYPGNHCNWWNYQKLSFLVFRAGFSKVYHSDAKQSVVSEMRGKKFDSTLPEISFFLEAVK